MAGDFLRGVQLGLFGMAGYMLRLFCLWELLCHVEQGKPCGCQKAGGCSNRFFSSLRLRSAFFGQDPEEGKSILAYYTMSARSGFGGGLAGGLLCAVLKGILGTIGAFSCYGCLDNYLCCVLLQSVLL